MKVITGNNEKKQGTSLMMFSEQSEKVENNVYTGNGSRRKIDKLQLSSGERLLNVKVITGRSKL